MFIMAGIPGGRHMAVRSDSDEPAMRDLLIACHFARYSGVSCGASALRPRDPSDSGAVRVGGGSGWPGAGAGAGAGAAARPPAAPAAGAPNGLIGRYTPEKSGVDAACCDADCAAHSGSAATTAIAHDVTVLPVISTPV